MPPRTWDEYLAEASAHLTEVRRTAERGAPPPPPPERPRGPVPDDRRAQARRRAVGYGQLGTEVATRLARLEERRPAPGRRSPHRAHRPARYIDTPV